MLRLILGVALRGARDKPILEIALRSWYRSG